MTTPRTLLSMAGANLTPGALGASALVLIDCQNEYVTGHLPLPGVAAALDQVAALLARARDTGTPIFHIAHKGRPGGLFDRDAAGGAIAAPAAPIPGEAVIEKALPNSFAGTGLLDGIRATGRGSVIFAGFMTHMCVSSTVRAALDLGLSSTVVASAAATRDLPAVGGGVISAADLHAATLAALSDRFAVVAPTVDAIPA